MYTIGLLAHRDTTFVVHDYDFYRMSVRRSFYVGKAGVAGAQACTPGLNTLREARGRGSL